MVYCFYNAKNRQNEKINENSLLQFQTAVMNKKKISQTCSPVQTCHASERKLITAI